jgi:cellulose synthase/poly-beta-1,6-N-acetylglucosamine synthase-like glycosyltransferase
VQFLFLFSLLVVFYATIGYPLVLWLLAMMFRKPVTKAEGTPYISILLSAHNEEKNIAARIDNLLALDYPREKMDIIIGSDGSTDETYRILKKLSEEKMIRYAVSFQRIGKPAMLNELAKDAKGAIFVFADAGQRLDPSAVKELIKCFADEEVGCAAGDLLAIEDKEPGSSEGAESFGNYEKALKEMEGSIGSILDTGGALYAIRSDFFKYLPQNLLLDGVFTPMNAIMADKRAVYAPAAKAYSAASEMTQKEFVHKVRAFVGSFQIFSIFAEALNPFRSKIAFQLFSHKFLRLAMPYFLILLFISNIFIMDKGPFFASVLSAQIIFCVLALLGYFLRNSGVRVSGALKVLYVPYEFCALNAAAAVALFAFLSGGLDVKWGK